MQVSVRRIINNSDLPVIDESKIPTLDGSKVFGGNLDNVERLWLSPAALGSIPIYAIHSFGFNTVISFSGPIVGPKSTDIVVPSSGGNLFSANLADIALVEAQDNGVLSEVQKSVTHKAWVSGEDEVTIRFSTSSSTSISTYPVKLKVRILRFSSS